MSARFRSTLLLAALSLADSLGAQTASSDCNRDEVRTLTNLGAWGRLHPDTLFVRFAPLRDAGLYADVADSLAHLFLVEAAPSPAIAPTSIDGITAAHGELLMRQMDSLRAELAVGPSAAQRGQVTITRFDIAFRPPSGPYSLFRGRAPGPITLDPLPSDTRRTICWLAMAAKDLATEFGKPGRTALAIALERRAERWDNFFGDGYSMLPHELLINGFMPRARLEPPRMQLILGHPSVGVQMTGDTFRSIREFGRVDVLSFEPVGFVFYGPQHRWYVGASWLMTVPTSGSTGSGVMLHLGDFGRAGYVIRPRDEDGKRRNAVVLSMDLYRYISSADECRREQKGVSPAAYILAAQSCLKRKP